MEKVLIRYSHPTVFEAAPYGTIWKEMGDDNKYTFFVQTGKDGLVNWLKMGDFLEDVFRPLLENPDFIEKCMYLRDAGSEKEVKDLLYGLGALFENLSE